MTESNHHGFMKKSYLTNLIATCDEMRAVDVVCLDIGNTFQTVPCSISTDKPMKYQLDKLSLKTVSFERVVINITKSSWMTVISGLLQGSADTKLGEVVDRCLCYHLERPQ